jgi:hypothetical protein
MYHIRKSHIILVGVVVCTLFLLLILVPRVFAASCFPDTEGHWAETFICWLRANGIVYGYDDGTYRPENNVKRGEMAVFINRGYELAEANDDDTLGGMSCMNGQIARWNGSSWVCDSDQIGTGDITAVYSGVGLTGGGTSGDVTINTNFAGSGSEDTVARSDHNHWGQTWSGSGVGLSLTSSDSYGGYFSNTSGGSAIYADGNVTQTRSGNGTIKAAVFALCNNPVSNMYRYFNNVNGATITISNGASLGICIIDFGFKVDDRFIVATAYHPTTPLGVTVFPISGNTVQFFVWHGVNGAAAGGPIFINVY